MNKAEERRLRCQPAVGRGIRPSEVSTPDFAPDKGRKKTKSQKAKPSNFIIVPRTKIQKKEIIERVKKIADEAKTLVFVNFHGIKVADATKIRRKLKNEGIGLFVAKKSLTKKALEGSKIGGKMPDMEGEVAMAYGTDLVAPAREVYAFQKEYKEAIKIIGGVFEGVFADAAHMVSIAAIPSQKTLHAMFVNVINSPIQGLVVGLDQIAKKKA